MWFSYKNNNKKWIDVTRKSSEVFLQQNEKLTCQTGQPASEVTVVANLVGAGGGQQGVALIPQLIQIDKAPRNLHLKIFSGYCKH